MKLNPSFMEEILAEKEAHYNLKIMSNIHTQKLRNTAYGLESEFPWQKSLAIYRVF